MKKEPAGRPDGKGDQMYHVFYNPAAGNGAYTSIETVLKDVLKGEAKFIDVTKSAGYLAEFGNLKPEDEVVIVGGDGTLNYFVNEVYGKLPENPIRYFACGTGNDFLRDVTGAPGSKELLDLRPYIEHLPTVTVNGKTSYFINGIGYGIDGYCCEVGDEERKKSDKPVNYTAIAIKGLLFHYKPTTAKVTVDGVTKTYRKTWLAPTMNGRCYGGGMYPTPDQDRLKNDTVSTLVYHNAGKLKALIVFPSIFKGEHVKHTEMIEILKGREVRVEFDRPVALQIDGETVLNVREYTVRAAE